MRQKNPRQEAACTKHEDMKMHSGFRERYWGSQGSEEKPG